MRNEKGQYIKGNIPWKKGKTKHEDSRIYGYWTGKKRPGTGKKTGDSLKKFHANMTEDEKVIFKAKMVPSMRGKKHSLKTRKLMSQKATGRKMSKESVEKNRKWALDHIDEIRARLVNARAMQSRNSKPTSIEKIMYELLEELGIVFEKQRVVNDRFVVDAYIPATNTIIECDGDYWHSLERVVKKDRAENAYLKRCGYNLIRIPEYKIKEKTFGDYFGSIYS